MSVIVQKTFSTTCEGALLEAINANGSIAPNLLQVISNVATPTLTDFCFDVALSGPEDTALDAQLSGWTCPVIPTGTSQIGIIDDNEAAHVDILWSSDRIQNELNALVLGDPDQDLFATFTADIGGPINADSTTDTLNLLGGTGITTSIVGDTILILPNSAELEGLLNHDNLLGFLASEHFTEDSIDHTNITNIGTNSHVQIDTHIADGTIHLNEEAVEDIVNGLLVGGINVTTTYNDGAGTLTIDGAFQWNNIITDTGSGAPDTAQTTLNILGGTNINTSLSQSPGSVDVTIDANVITDHGLLTGLGDNDHPQYLLVTDAPPFRTYDFFGDQVDFPRGTDWDVNNGAPASRDSNNSALKVRRFDDSTTEAVGFSINVPNNSTDVIVRTTARAETAPGGAATASLVLHLRQIANNGAVGAWSSSSLTTVNLPAGSEFFQRDETSFTLAALGLTAGETYQMQLSRNPGSDSLVGDLSLLGIQLEFR